MLTAKYLKITNYIAYFASNRPGWMQPKNPLNFIFLHHIGALDRLIESSLEC
jgi:hypothetical protein